MGPLTSPSTIPEDWNLDLNNLGPQLCLLNLITSQEQSDDPVNTNFGATDHMTYDRNLFNSITPPPRDSIVTANGDIKTQAIIRRGTKRKGLYYVDDSDVGDIFKMFYHMIYTQYSLSVKVLRSDKGGEYLNQDLSQFCKEKGAPKTYWANVTTRIEDYEWVDVPGPAVFGPTEGSPDNGSNIKAQVGMVTNKPPMGMAIEYAAELDSSPQSPNRHGNEADAAEMDSSSQSPNKHDVFGCCTENNQAKTISGHATISCLSEVQGLGVNSCEHNNNFSLTSRVHTLGHMDIPFEFDVKNVFFHGDLEEEVYMDFPPGYGIENFSGRALKKCGYRQGNSDHTLFIKRKGGKVTLLIIYVDDMIVTCDDTIEIEQLQVYLSSEFEMKDLGGLKYFLGIEIAWSQEGIYLSQRKYVLDLLSETVKKQNVVVRSSVEAEYRGMAHGICELLWLRILLTEIGFKPKESMIFYCDNQASREIANNPIQHDITKHVEVDRHFIKEKLDVKLVDIPFVRTEEQLANILTHVVSVGRF
ncbi:hypothetical protein D8674_002663 [Pyrus ussuriensis x Pyrus communis]|uniref:Reverse transcriptase Ty1/copia-type domain-containing protein n=1 Tax=Pyrus ussuriensis x Pyrus communis TaxID=2448454 RepID=A0A5N5FEX8_9ROSA|nr:hypothetical protein D8674_002663 [Pyrus ussuriensis x Pyrus communis]